MLTGLVFGHVYCALAVMDPGSIRLNQPPHGIPQVGEQQFFLLAYFSFMTLATVGYGDMTPGSDAARALAVLEAILGQFYIAVLIAELVSKRGKPPAPEATGETKAGAAR